MVIKLSHKRVVIIITSSSKRKTSSARPITKEETCKFRISLRYEIRENKWHILSKGQPTHTYHINRTFEQMKCGTSQINDSIKEIIDLASKSDVSSSAIQKLAASNFNATIDTDTILYQKRRLLEDKVVVESSAEEILHLLEGIEGISVVKLYGEEDRTDLLTDYKKKKKRTLIRGTISLNGVEEEVNGDTGLFDTYDSFKALTKMLLFTHDDASNSAEESNEKILLAVGWAMDSDLRVFRQFPEVLKMDTTFRTNREGRPLYNVVVKDSNDKLTTVFCCLLPSEKGVIFNWLLQHALRRLFGDSHCHRVQTIITDGDSTEITTVLGSLHNVYPNAVHINCLWHIVDRGLKTDIKDKRIKELLRNWTVSFIVTNTKNDLERNEAVELLKVRCMHVYVSENAIWSQRNL